MAHLWDMRFENPLDSMYNAPSCKLLSECGYAIPENNVANLAGSSRNLLVVRWPHSSGGNRGLLSQRDFSENGSARLLRMESLVMNDLTLISTMQDGGFVPRGSSLS